MNVGAELYGRTCGLAYYSLIRTLLEPQYRTIGSPNYSEIVGLQLIIKEPQYNLVASRNRPVNYVQGFKDALELPSPHQHFFEHGDKLASVVQLDYCDGWSNFVEEMQRYSYRAAIYAGSHKVYFDALVLQIGEVYLKPENHKAALNFVCYDAGVKSLESPMPIDFKLAAKELFGGGLVGDYSIAGLRPVYAAIRGDRNHAPAVVNELYYADYGTGWPASVK
jgi:hypothetical protein